VARGESYAGITVPEGSPDELRTLAGSFSSTAESLQGVSARLNAMPSELSTWQGPASVGFAGSSATAASAANSGALSFLSAAISVRAYAIDLEDAQRDAERAIDDAREAKERIRQAERDIADAGRRADAASLAIVAATTRIMAASLSSTPDLGAEADLAAAQRALDEAQADERRAQRELDRARDDLERAQKRGDRAMDRARTAASTAAVAVNAASSGIPPLQPLGGPALPVLGGGGTVGVPPLLPLTQLPQSRPPSASGRPQPELGPYYPPGPPPPLIPFDQNLADTLTDTGTILNYGGALAAGVSKRNALLTKYFPGAPTRPGGPPTGPGLVNRALTNSPGARTALKVGGRALPVVGAGVDYAANRAGGDSPGRALRKTAVNTAATAAGTAGGGLACGAATASTFGAGAAACPVLIVGGTAVGAAGGWAVNKGIDALESIIP
jgi:uncharacterized protein YukE